MALAKTLLKPSEIIESKLYLKAILCHFDIKNLALQLGYSRATVHYWINNERNLSLESLENMRSLCQRTLTEKELENIAIRGRIIEGLFQRL